MPHIRVSRLYISARTAAKIAGKHGISVTEIDNALLGGGNFAARWVNDPDLGARLLVQIVLRGRRAIVVLYPRGPAGDDEWALGSAYFR